MREKITLIEKFSDKFYDFSPFLWRLFYKTFDFNSHKNKIKRFFQRLYRGWDDSETWSLDTSFYNWLLPRLKRFTELTVCYPHSYKKYEDWISELNYRCKQLELIIKYDYEEYEFDCRDYITDEQIIKKYKVREEQQTDKTYLNMKAYEHLITDFNEWFGQNVNALWW